MNRAIDKLKKEKVTMQIKHNEDLDILKDKMFKLQQINDKLTYDIQELQNEN